MWTKSFDVKKLLAMGLSMAMVAFFMTACSDDGEEDDNPPPPPPLTEYEVIVDIVDEDGDAIVTGTPEGTIKPRVTGEGWWEEAETVTLTARDTAGWTFLRWESEEFEFTGAAATARSITFEMPSEDVVITAVYELAPLHIATVTVEGGDFAGVCAIGEGCEKEVWETETEAYEYEIVYLYPGEPEDPDHVFLGWTTSPTSLAANIVDEGNGVYSFIMIGRDVTVTANWGALPKTYIRFNWDVAEEESDLGALWMVVADEEFVDMMGEMLDDLFDEVCEEVLDEATWEDSDCAIFMTSFPRYPGIAGDFPIIFVDEVPEASQRNEWLTIDNDANMLLTVGTAQFTAIAAVEDIAYDDVTLIVANYEITPATASGEEVDYTLVFDIYKFLEDECEDSPEGQCILFGEGEAGDDLLLKGQQRRPNFVRRVPGTFKAANGMDATYYVVRAPKSRITLPNR